MTLTIELPDNLEAALKAQADAQGISEAGYVRTLLERDLSASEEIDAARADITEQSRLAAERIRELRKGNFLPEGVTIRALMDEGRA